MEISVCIPAYKNAEFLDRNLNALANQDFKDFEVILSDDSPDDSVASVAEEYKNKLNIRYFKNSPSLGTPANWNFAMQQAAGRYIKLIHDDDWLAGNESLQKYYDALEANPSADFCFSGFHNVNLKTGEMEMRLCSTYLRKLLAKSPYNLFKRNFIGPPSAVFQRNNLQNWYDDQFRWLVDFEGYTRFLTANKNFVYINECLVNIGISAEQVTSFVQHDASVVLPESFYFLEKHGPGILKNMWVYDYYWRMLRNFSITDQSQVIASGYMGELPPPIKSMIKKQSKISRKLLKFGPASKLLMMLSYARS